MSFCVTATGLAVVHRYGNSETVLVYFSETAFALLPFKLHVGSPKGIRSDKGEVEKSTGFAAVC